MNKLLIVFDVSFPFVKGGAQRRFYEVGKRVSETGVEVDWMTFQSWPGGPIIENNGIRYLSLGKLPKLYNKSGKRSKVEPIIFFFKFLLNIFQIRKYDTVWIGQWPMLHLFPAIVFARLFGVKLVVDWWEVWSRENWQSYSFIAGSFGYILQSILLRLIVKNSIIVTDSKLESLRIKDVVKSEAEVYWIPNGIPVDEIGAVDLEATTKYDIASLGRLKNHKGLDLLIRAIWILKERDKYKVTAAIVGDGPEWDALNLLVKDLGLTEQVRLFGQIEDFEETYEIIKSCKVCAITTINGGGGNLTLFEAYGCGLPVIAFSLEEGIDEDLIDDGKTGIFVHSVNAESLADALRDFLQNPEQIRIMKRYSYQKSLDYGWDRVAEKYSNIIFKV
jgi:L-malate glycosyltransferase